MFFLLILNLTNSMFNVFFDLKVSVSYEKVCKFYLLSYRMDSLKCFSSLNVKCGYKREKVFFCRIEGG